MTLQKISQTFDLKNRLGRLVFRKYNHVMKLHGYMDSVGKRLSPFSKICKQLL